MNNFDLCMPTRVIFGRDTHKGIGAELKPYAKKVLLHYGGGSVVKSGLLGEVKASLAEAGIDVVELGGVVPNPRLTKVYEGIELCGREGVELILAVGGGSVIDSAKAIAVGCRFDGDIWDVYEQGKTFTDALPVAVVLTLPASGSETSSRSVISNDEKQMKLSLSSVLARPLISVINPELFFSLPENQIANGVTDIMSHIFERYFTNTTGTDLTDGLCEATLKTIIRNAPLVYKNHSDYDAWCQIGFAGAIAHNDLLGVGRVEDWGSHRIEHQLSAVYDVAHGAGLAVLTPAWMKYVYKTNVNMFVQFAVNVMGVSGSFREPEAIVLEGIRRLSEFFKELGLPSTLAEFGIDESAFEMLAKKATGELYGKEQPLGGLQKLYWRDVLEILKLAR